MTNVRIERTINTHDEGDISAGIALNAVTSITVAVANESRIGFYLSNSSNQSVFLKFQAASVDDDAKGILLIRNATYEMPTDNIYTGEISAIAVNGTPSVFVTEY